MTNNKLTDELRSFYDAYSSWVNAGAQPCKLFSRGHGLCVSAYDYFTAVGVDVESPLEAMHEAFAVAGLKEELPFNENPAHYRGEQRRLECHINPARLAWVASELQERRKADSAEPIGWTDAEELRSVERDGCGYLFKANPITPHADPLRVIKLYAVPPAPVVPEGLLSAMEEVLRISDRDHEVWHKVRSGIASCRAAMLQAGFHHRPLLTPELKWRAEQCECVSMCLDDNGVPKNEGDEELSLWGRVQKYAAMLQAGSHTEQHLDMVDHSGYANEKVDCRLTFDQWLSQQDGTIDVDCGCVTTESFYHWLRVAYEASNSPAAPDSWIPVSERMPSDGDIVLVVDDGYFVCEAQHRSGNFYSTARGRDDFFETECRDVAYWMPFPATPQR